MVNCNPDAVLAADVVCLLMGDHTLICTEVLVPLVATPEWLMKAHARYSKLSQASKNIAFEAAGALGSQAVQTIDIL
jgi:hypothetical protein